MNRDASRKGLQDRQSDYAFRMSRGVAKLRTGTRKAILGARICRIANSINVMSGTGRDLERDPLPVARAIARGAAPA